MILHTLVSGGPDENIVIHIVEDMACPLLPDNPFYGICHCCKDEGG